MSRVSRVSQKTFCPMSAELLVPCRLLVVVLLPITIMDRTAIQVVVAVVEAVVEVAEVIEMAQRLLGIEMERAR